MSRRSVEPSARIRTTAQGDTGAHSLGSLLHTQNAQMPDAQPNPIGQPDTVVDQSQHHVVGLSLHGQRKRTGLAVAQPVGDALLSRAIKRQRRFGVERRVGQIGLQIDLYRGMAASRAFDQVTQRLGEAEIRAITEAMIRTVFRKTMGVELPVYGEISYADAMHRYGSDKPDLRVKLELTELTEVMKTVDFKVFSGPATISGQRQRRSPRDGAWVCVSPFAGSTGALIVPSLRRGVRWSCPPGDCAGAQG